VIVQARASYVARLQAGSFRTRARESAATRYAATSCFAATSPLGCADAFRCANGFVGIPTPASTSTPSACAAPRRGAAASRWPRARSRSAATLRLMLTSRSARVRRCAQDYGVPVHVHERRADESGYDLIACFDPPAGAGAGAAINVLCDESFAQGHLRRLTLLFGTCQVARQEPLRCAGTWGETRAVRGRGRRRARCGRRRRRALGGGGGEQARGGGGEGGDWFLHCMASWLTRTQRRTSHTCLHCLGA